MLIVEKTILLDSLNWLIRAVPFRPSIQALEGIVITPNSNSSVTLSAYNNELYMENTISAEVKTDQKIIIPGKLFYEMVKSIPSSKIEIKKDEKLNKFVILGEKNKFTINSILPDEYPAVLEKGDKIGTINSEELFSSIAKTYNASNHDESVPVLASVKMSFKENEIQYDSTDRFRLAKAIGGWKNETGFENQILVGSRAINELSKAFKEKGDLEISLRKGSNDKSTTIAFSSQDKLIILPLLNVEKFPQTDSLFAAKYETQVMINTKHLLEALSRASIVSLKNRVTLDFQESQINITAGESSDIGSTDENLQARIAGSSKKVIYNIGYLKDGIEPIQTKNICIKINEPQRPNEIVALDEKGNELSTYKYLIVPISS
ncbi:MAG: DNA polymerase III subunit beta [Bifidobacteriaceae bacterium]|jgi:DNA polymerase-3 subunit beta|nr:DNA polymerase III subunit beta [Bifidobacteriaceae bacterium]